MVLDCKDYEQRGYCLRGPDCPNKHGSDLIELDISSYKALVEAKNDTIAKAAAIALERQLELKRKQTDLLSNLVSQQRELINKIELCSDEAEKERLKLALNQMLQKTKDWIEQEGKQKGRELSTVTSASSSDVKN